MNSTPLPSPRAYSIAEAAAALRVSGKTICRMIEAGKVTAAQVTERRRVIPASEITRILRDEAP